MKFSFCSPIQLGFLAIPLPIFLSVAYLSMQFSAIDQASGSDVQNLGYGKVPNETKFWT